MSPGENDKPALKLKIRPATRIPSGISDESGSIGAVEFDNGLLDAIDLIKGKRIALSDAPLTPIYLRGREILVRKQDPLSCAILLELLHIGGHRLDSVWVAEPQLPDWACEEAAMLSFDVGWSDHRFHVSWVARRKATGGIMRASDYARAETGLIRVDARSGTIADMEQHEPDHADPQDAYELALNLELIPFRKGPERIEAPWSIDGRETILTRRSLDGKTGVFLRFHETDDTQTQHEAALSEETLQDPVATVDGRILMLFNGDGWDLFSSLDGSPRGSLPLEQEVEEVSIFDARVIYALDEKETDSYQVATRVRRSLVSRDRQSGKLLWSYVLYDKELPADSRTIPEGGSPSMPRRLRQR